MVKLGLISIISILNIGAAGSMRTFPHFLPFSPLCIYRKRPKGNKFGPLYRAKTVGRSEKQYAYIYTVFHPREIVPLFFRELRGHYLQGEIERANVNKLKHVLRIRCAYQAQSRGLRPASSASTTPLTTRQRDISTHSHTRQVIGVKEASDIRKNSNSGLPDYHQFSKDILGLYFHCLKVMAFSMEFFSVFESIGASP